MPTTATKPSRVGRFATAIGAAVADALGTPVPGGPEPKTTRSPRLDFAATGSSQDLASKIGRTESRLAMLTNARKMYNADDWIRSGIDGIGEDATPNDNDGEPFKVEWEEEKAKNHPRFEEAKDYVDELLGRPGVNLRYRAPKIISEMLLEGDVFAEIVVQEKPVVDIEEIILCDSVDDGALTEIARSPKTGRLLGYLSTSTMDRARTLRVWNPWQIAHFSTNPERYRYGLPLLSSSGRSFSYLYDAESDMKVARREGAWERLAMIFPDADEETLREMMDKHIEMQRLAPPGVRSDVFASGDVKVLGARLAGIREMGDIVHHKKKLLASLRRPRALYGGEGEDLNRDTLRRQISAYLRFTTRLRSAFAQGLDHFLVIALTLRGFDVSALPFRTRWTEQQADDWGDRVKALSELRRESDLPRETVWEESGFTVSRERERLEREKEESADETEARRKAEIAEIEKQIGLADREEEEEEEGVPAGG